MDQRTAAIDQDLKDIVETRIDIAEKLELLEQRIKDTAEGATMKFSRMVNEGTESVTHLMDKTKAALDPIHKVDDYPWLMLGGAICAGYAIGLLESRARAQRGVYAYYPPGAHASRVMPEPNRRGAASSNDSEGVYDYYPDPSQARPRQETRNRQSVWETISRELGTDSDQAKNALMQAGRSMVLELAGKLLPEIARSLGVTLSSQGKEAEKPQGSAASSESRSGSSARHSRESAAQSCS